MTTTQPRQGADPSGAARARPPEDRVRAIVTSVAKRQLPLFAAFRHVELDDLIQEATRGVYADWPKFDPARAGESTFIYRSASGEIVDLYRKLKRQHDRDARHRELVAAAASARRLVDWADAGDTAGLPGGAGGDDETLEDWAGRVHAYAERCFCAPRGRGRKPSDLTPAQRAAIVLLRRRLHLSVRGVVLVLRQRPDLRRAIGLKHVISKSSAQKVISWTLSLGLDDTPDGGLGARFDLN